MFPPSESPNRERGQMLVIVALGLTVLIAMAGLIIDGGMALSNRRQVQNAADAASLAGTRVLGLDLKWRADNRPPPAPFANVDQAVCDAINDALVYNTNRRAEHRRHRLLCRLRRRAVRRLQPQRSWPRR